MAGSRARKPISMSGWIAGALVFAAFATTSPAATHSFQGEATAEGVFVPLGGDLVKAVETGTITFASGLPYPLLNGVAEIFFDLSRPLGQQATHGTFEIFGLAGDSVSGTFSEFVSVAASHTSAVGTFTGGAGRYAGASGGFVLDSVASPVVAGRYTTTSRSVGEISLPVPEPDRWALMVVAIVLIAARMPRARRRAVTAAAPEAART